MFIGPPAAQATTAVFEWPELTAVTDLASAKAAIELIIEQGEGARGDWRTAHFGKFASLLDEYLAARRADPGFEPARRVVPAWAQRPPDGHRYGLIGDPLTFRVADLLDAVYEVILQTLTRYFVHDEETPAELTTLAKTAKHLMNRVMRPLGSTLTTLPAGPASPGQLAAPAFRIVRPAFYVLPHRRAAWTILVERLDTLADACAGLAGQPGLTGLAVLEENLRSMSGDLQAHLAARAGRQVG